jgi:hypothetical protein
MDKIAHYFLIDGGSSPSVISKIIMEELENVLRLCMVVNIVL